MNTAIMAASTAAAASSSSASTAVENASKAANATAETAVNSGSDFAVLVFFFCLAFIGGIWLAVILSGGNLQ